MAVGKTELIERVATTTGLPKAQVSQTIETMLSEVQGALSSGDSVTLRGFGTFGRRESAARTGRNPRTGEEIAIPARTSISFKASKPAGRAESDGATTGGAATAVAGAAQESKPAGRGRARKP